MRRRRLSFSHHSPSEVDDITMTSFESQILVLLQLHLHFLHISLSFCKMPMKVVVYA